MTLGMIQAIEGICATLAVIGLAVDSAPRWWGWLGFSLFVAFDTWRCLRVGTVCTGPKRKWYAFTLTSGDSPEMFLGVVVLRVLLALGLFLVFLCSV